ncbi:ribonuclease H-like domain-containing protein [Granulicella sp. S190]|uniref:ribonuclease H-like domain-containing protein n=1 Tax=Granulicella sp. S190 TaxID=1747226 RepID=UPI00131B0F19|nr:ribonuclease H-like domain-containing protein [Granulicella sp. S190]
MLEKTFLHIPGIGAKTELELWHSGIRSWQDLDGFFTRPAAISRGLRRRLEEHIPQSIDAMQRKDAHFFTRLSSLGEGWRLFPEFANQCVFLDIETTGLSPVFDKVTMVGLYEGNRYQAFIEGQNLEDLPAQLKKYSVVVTFNGSGFDLRFLKLAFKDLELPPIHIDLRWVTRRLGHRGGLKVIEKDFGICRDSSVEDIDGHDATVLWSRHLRGDKDALQQLITYNSEDVVHLKAIMEMSYDRLALQASGGLWKGKEIYEGVNSLPKTPRARKRISTKGNGTLVDDLLRRSSISTPRIVGIDLTGSERRATGWSLLVGSNAETKSISTDEDLIRETIAAKPDLVSIDSPLSVPDGWNRAQEQLVADSPIYRKCELALKRMGISVFWCLLPSMKSLTMRGMRLTDELRSHGLKVIESYPGAAQDILGIPRKGSSLAELKWGLNRAGIEGPYLKNKVTHDEVDAITSALVGLFYLADDYIALGTPSEDYLIVPRSPQINYTRLSEILARSGLDEIHICASLGTTHLQ